MTATVGRADTPVSRAAYATGGGMNPVRSTGARNNPGRGLARDGAVPVMPYFTIRLGRWGLYRPGVANLRPGPICGIYDRVVCE